MNLNYLGRSLLMLSLILLGGCGRQEESVGNAGPQQSARQSSQSQATLDTFVKAVTVTVGESPIELRFDLPQRPEPGQPFVVRLRLTGLLDSQDLSVKLTAPEHVKIVSGNDWSLSELAAGQAQEREMSVRADGTGVYVLSADVQTTRESYTKTVTFAVPVAVTEAAASGSSASASAPAASK